MEFKLKEKHYKNSRFTGKTEKELSEFKKQNITTDLEEVKIISQENISFFTQILRKNGLIQIPEKNSVTSIRTQSQINSFAIILQFIEKYGSIDFLSVQTYTFDEKTVYSFYELLNNGKIKQLEIIMTETAVFRLPKIYKLVKELFASHERCNVCFYWVHSKIYLIRCGLEKYVIDGSGNFSMNAQIEHYNIFNSEKMFNFDFELNQSFYFGVKLRKKHEIFKNYDPCQEVREK